MKKYKVLFGGLDFDITADNVDIYDNRYVFVEKVKIKNTLNIEVEEENILASFPINKTVVIYQPEIIKPKTPLGE